jgi:hypothetical protein
MNIADLLPPPGPEIISPTDGAAPPPEDSIFAFTPVPLTRRRSHGWSPEVQRAFIHALTAMGSVGMAARAVGMGRRSAYRLREHAGAESFAAAWDAALNAGRWRHYDAAIDRALNGHTIIRINRGGSVTINNGPDLAIMNAAIRERPAGVNGDGGDICSSGYSWA